jgi:hypothetical protein
VGRIRTDHPLLKFALALAVIAHLVLALGMAANHEVHEWIHGDADHEEHECVVQLLLHGGCDSATVEAPALTLLPLASEPAPALVFADVPSLFLTGGILEHAPPRSV